MFLFICSMFFFQGEKEMERMEGNLETNNAADSKPFQVLMCIGNRRPSLKVVCEYSNGKIA